MDYLEILKTLEADVEEIQAVVNKIVPIVEAVVTTLGKLQPVISGILAVLKGLHIL